MLEESVPTALELDREFLERVLRESEADPGLSIVGLRSTPACDLGDNFMSAVSRLQLTATTSHSGVGRRPVRGMERVRHDSVFGLLAHRFRLPPNVPFHRCVMATSDGSINKTVLMKRQPASIARRQAFRGSGGRKVEGARAGGGGQSGGGRPAMRRSLSRAVSTEGCKLPTSFRRRTTRSQPQNRCDPAFKNEAAAYRTVIPALQEFAGSRMPFPECLHASSQFVVLEDLKQAGYRMADRTVGLDMQHAKLALKELGRFHGTSLAMKSAQPASFELVKTAVQELVYVPDAVPVFGASLENSLRMALMALEVFRAAGETAIQEAVHKMQILRGSVFQRMLKLVTPREPLAVMCHGDFYINNMMFKYNENGDPEGVTFVDLQVCRYASLATDILYFLYSSLQPGVVSLYHDELIEVYHSELNHQIASLAPQAKQVSFEEVLDEMETHALYGLIMSFLILPAVTAVPGTINLDKVESTTISEFVESARDILSPVYFERVRELVLTFVDRGYI